MTTDQRGPSVTERANVLFRWRSLRSGAGISRSELPTDDSLWIIAGASTASADQIVGLRCPDPAVARWAEEMSTALAEAFPSTSEGFTGTEPTIENAWAAERRAALYAWREAMLAQGHQDSDLPPVEDLERIASSTARSEREIGNLPFRQSRALVRRHAASIAQALERAPATADPDRSGAPARSSATDPTVSRGGSGFSTGVPTPARGTVGDTNGTNGAHGESAPAESFGESGFAPFNQAGISRAPAPIGVSQDAAGTLRYTWEAPKVGGVVLTRLVYRDDTFPRSPERGRIIAVTSGSHALDSAPVTGACRYVEAWVHVGATEEEAKSTQPFLHARTALVAPVQDCVIKADGQDVIGAWTPVHSSVLRVEVHRVPIAQAHEEWAVGEPVCPDEGNVDGFTDVSCPPGEYEYRVGVWAMVDGNEKCSPLATVAVTVSGSLAPVEDLLAQPVPGRDDAVSLSWTAPAWGEVRIYRTPRPARAGSDDTDLDITALPGAGLKEEDWCRAPIRANGTGRRIPSLGIGDDAAWLVFTPVTIGGSKARIGRHVTFTRTGSLQDVEIVERVDFQLLTFGWPAEAERVEVYVTKPGTPLPQPPGAPVAVMTQEQHRRLGGILLERGKLNRNGCAVHVLPAYTFEYKQRFGQPVTVNYPGLVVLGYQLAIETQQGLLGKVRRTRTRRLEVRSTDDLVDVRAVLVHNDRQLPLSEQDGTVLLQLPSVSLTAGQPAVLGQVEPPEFGWIRLFVLPRPGDAARPLALLDPVPAQLRCTRE